MPARARPRPASALDSAERRYFPTRAAWRKWLARHHARTAPLWLIYDKKQPGLARRLSYDDIVEEALCFGWIDSLPRKLSDTQSMLYLCPRKPGSGWSALNKRRIESLTARGLIAPPGQAKIDAARADGSWTLLDAAESLELPPELAAAFKLRKNARAAAAFNTLPPGARKRMIWSINSAKRPETRAARIQQVLTQAHAAIPPVTKSAAPRRKPR